MVPNKFKDWIRRLAFNKHDEGECTHITIRHVAGKNSEDIARHKMLSVASIEEGEAESAVSLFADELWTAAQNDANAFQGLQVYAFHSWFESEPNKSVTRYTGRFQSEQDEEMSDDESVSEPPNKTGLVSQAMRHAEAFARIGTQASIHQLSMQQRTIESQQRLIEQMTKDRLETFALVEELSSKKHERDLEMKEKEATTKIKTEFLERVAPLLPIIAAKVTGMPLLPSGKSSPAVKELLGSVTEEQMTQLSTILRPEQIGLLANMMQEQQDEENKPGVN